MVKKYLHKLLHKQHYWRTINFDELSEIYAATMMRSLAISMVGIFIPVYLYKLGYSITLIFIVFAAYFSSRVVLDFVSAFTTARIGPKHTMIIGQALQITSSALFLTLPAIHWPLLLVGGVWGSAASFYFIPFHIDLSKIKHKNHGGKELGYVQIMEKIGQVLGPIIGGIVATMFSPRYIFLVSIVMLIAGLWPLFRTAEPVQLKQKLDYKTFPLHKVRMNIPAYIGLNIENTFCLMLWPLFLAIFVLPGNAVFAKVGALLSISVVASILAARAIGQTVDNKKGRVLLRYSATINALVYLVRLIVVNYPMALVTNIANEAVTMGYRLPFTKGFYDQADDLPGYRIVYISSMEVIGCIAKATAWWFLVALSTILSPRTVITVGFAIAAAASLLIMTEKFDSLNYNTGKGQNG